jgi:hypothetical protein
MNVPYMGHHRQSDGVGVEILGGGRPANAAAVPAKGMRGNLARLRFRAAG